MYPRVPLNAREGNRIGGDRACTGVEVQQPLVPEGARLFEWRNCEGAVRPIGKRERLGWVATNEEHTHARLGSAPSESSPTGPAPRGFLVHGGDSILWTAYLNGGAIPRGADFVRAVREIAARAGVDSSPLDRPEPRDRRAALLHDFFDLCQRELVGNRGVEARAYLERRAYGA